MGISSVLSTPKRMLFVIVAAALLIRLVLMPLLTYDFDIYHWALIISNINSGNNLYNLDGYYYTPVWGYMLGFIQLIEQFFVDNGMMAERFTSMLDIENLQYPYHIATVTSIGFNILMKIPLILCDIAVGYLIYWLVKDRTGSEKKAVYGLAFWLFCPVVIYMASVQAMFDTFSALLFLLSVILFYKGKYFVGGAMFSTVVLLKFFPAFSIFVLLAYVLLKHKNDGLAKRKVLEAVAGMTIMAVILMAPLILNGQFGDAFMFVFGRVGDGAPLGKGMMMASLIALGSMFYFGYRMYFRTSVEDADKKLFFYILLTATASVLISAAPQYVIIVMPFLILQMIAVDRSYFKLWVIIGTAACLGAIAFNNLSLFSALSAYTGIITPEWIISGMRLFETNVLGTNVHILTIIITQGTQYVGTLLILAFGLSEIVKRRIPVLTDLLMRVMKWGTKEVSDDES